MEKVKKKLKEINPFVINSPIEVVEYSFREKHIKLSDLPNGEAVATNFTTRDIGTRIILDRTPSMKYYLKEDLLKVYMSMGPPARKLMDYIMFALEKNADKIVLDIKEVAKVMLCGDRTVYNAINELKTLGFIARHSASTFWINPHFIFKGNRTKAYKDHLDLKGNLIKK